MDIASLPEDMKLFPLKAVAEILGTSIRTIHRYMKDGRLEARKVGGQWRVSQKAINDFIQGKTSCHE